MSFLTQPFEHDVFVSYAHGRAGRLKAWTQHLVDELKAEIVDFEDGFSDFDLFIDTELDPALPLTPQLRAKVSASGILLVIMSHWYLRSSWCNDEIDWFENVVSDEGRGEGFVLVVRATPTDTHAWPKCLIDERGHAQPGFQFHAQIQKPDQAGGIRPFGYPIPQPDDKDFQRELSKLQTIIVQRLRKMKEREELTAATVTARPDRGTGAPTVYLDAPVSRSEEWNATKHKLTEGGFQVLPDDLNAGGTVSDLQAWRVDRLNTLREKAHAACLLRVEDDERAQQHIQALVNDRLSLELAGKSLPCAIIDKVGGDLSVVKRFGIETIEATRDNWLPVFRNWFDNSFGAEPAR